MSHSLGLLFRKQLQALFRHERSGDRGRSTEGRDGVLVKRLDRGGGRERASGEVEEEAGASVERGKSTPSTTKERGKGSSHSEFSSVSDRR